MSIDSLSEGIKGAIGVKFNMWTVLRFVKYTEYAYRGKYIRYPIVEARCDCGTISQVRLDNIRRGLSKCCGCHKKVKHGYAGIGENRKRVYRIWQAMITRCYNKKQPSYAGYGARGILVCSRWLGKNGFVSFISDMGEPPTDKHSIDRINNRGNYEPSNCRWADRKTQNSNTRRNRYVVVNGEKMTMRAAEEKLGFSRDVIQRRIHDYGYSEEEAVAIPLHGRKTRPIINSI